MMNKPTENEKSKKCINPPLDIKGKPLPTGNTKEDKRARKKDYAIQSILFAVVFVVIDIIFMLVGEGELTDFELTEILFSGLSKPLTVVIGVVMDFVILFLISYLIEYLIGEKYTVKKYNRMKETLDNE